MYRVYQGIDHGIDIKNVMPQSCYSLVFSRTKKPRLRVEFCTRGDVEI